MDKNIEINIDFNNIDKFALEITKAYLEKNSNNKFSSPKMFTSIFIATYSRILTELELIKQNKEYLSSIIDRAMKLDFSEFDED